ncbi:ead/Ea22-like family protein [Klebsiella pneumoniae]|uniref:ead/Ea22-like family protein n=1 Tax=Klebsiella pneumoniae TaxID=573 RepID=UPI000E5D03D1|nr:ead/Ea22-like family protein [Klebsiella pneumoniae]AXZ12643.1 ead/Ea22-like family protein [Klebsiella pneumoniae]
MTTNITALAQSLKAAAEKAGVEQWVNNRGEVNTADYEVDGGTYIDHICDCEIVGTESPRAEFIALANPANVSALVEALEKAQQRNAELEAQNEYIRKRYQQLDLLIGKNILVMQAAIIEWQATGDAKNGLAWIYNTLFGPGELPDEAEKDAQAYFDRKYAPLDEELMALHKWFWEQSEAERAAAGIKMEVE